MKYEMFALYIPNMHFFGNCPHIWLQICLPKAVTKHMQPKHLSILSSDAWLPHSSAKWWVVLPAAYFTGSGHHNRNSIPYTTA